MDGRTLLALAAIASLGLLVAFSRFLGGTTGLAVFGVMFAVVFGFLVAAACGYMAGIVGSSASPISGIAILAVSVASLFLLALGLGPAGIPLALFATSAVLAVATISNDNLQDLKTGQLVSATPARQQWALVIGSLVGAAVIPPILDLLYQAYGFTGALPRPGMDAGRALAAPQATLMTAIASGILGRSLDWTMIAIGMALGVVLVATDTILRARTARLRLPVLATGIGIYLPASVSATLAVGALCAWAASRGRKEGGEAERRGILIASGFIVGESLMGVLLAGIIGSTGREDALSVVGADFAPAAATLGAAVFVLCCAGLVRAANFRPTSP